MADQNPPRFRVTCRHCRRAILSASRVTNAEADQLRGHLVRHHPTEAPPHGANLGGTLAHFDVERFTR
jgi:hypothetical protein